MSDIGPLPLPEPSDAEIRALEIGVNDFLREAAGEVPPTDRDPGVVGSGAMELMGLWLEEQQSQPRRLYDGLNPDVELDPTKSAVENFRALYDGNPPEQVDKWGKFLDEQAVLLHRFETGEITADEFGALHEQLVAAHDNDAVEDGKKSARQILEDAGKTSPDDLRHADILDAMMSLERMFETGEITEGEFLRRFTLAMEVGGQEIKPPTIPPDGSMN